MHTTVLIHPGGHWPFEFDNDHRGWEVPSFNAVDLESFFYRQVPRGNEVFRRLNLPPAANTQAFAGSTQNVLPCLTFTVPLAFPTVLHEFLLSSCWCCFFSSFCPIIYYHPKLRVWDRKEKEKQPLVPFPSIVPRWLSKGLQLYKEKYPLEVARVSPVLLFFLSNASILADHVLTI